MPGQRSYQGSHKTIANSNVFGKQCICFPTVACQTTADSHTFWAHKGAAWLLMNKMAKVHVWKGGKKKRLIGYNPPPPISLPSV